jgi:hypothetical protein
MSTKRHAEEVLVLALTSGVPVPDAARQSVLSEIVVRRKLAVDRFRQRVVRARGELTAQATGLLTAAGLVAARVLAELLMPGRPPALRLAAAKAVIEIGIKLRTVVDLETQVADLERRLDQQQAAAKPDGGWPD